MIYTGLNNDLSLLYPRPTDTDATDRGLALLIELQVL
jgi:hypothetical protein